jgi:SAM-dependent methyltransferase
LSSTRPANHHRALAAGEGTGQPRNRIFERHRFRRERLAIPLLRSRWSDLPAATGERFDVVLCTGNALAHATGRDAMVQALTGLRRMARPGGHVVVDPRNWEKLHAERQIVQRICARRLAPGRPAGHLPNPIFERDRNGAAVDAGSTAGVFEPGYLSLEDALPEAQCLGGLVDAGVLGGHERTVQVPPCPCRRAHLRPAHRPGPRRLRGGQFAPDPATGIVGLPGVCCVHSGLLVFTKPGKPASSAELKDSRR